MRILLLATLLLVACEKPEPQKFPVVFPGYVIPPAGFYMVASKDITPANHLWTLVSGDGIVHELRFIGQYPDDIGFDVMSVKYVVTRPGQGIVVLIDRNEKMFYRWAMYPYHK